MLNAHNVYKKFGEHLVLNDVSIEIPKSSVVGLVGSSGGGKSTLLRCLQGLEKIDEGKIERKGAVSFMFQDFQLFPHMTVLENIVYAPRRKWKGKAYNEQALALLEELGIADKPDAYPHNLSGGQKQRVALARCLMIQPDVLLCDEPTSGLDERSVAGVADVLRDVKKKGVAMVVASHDLAFLHKIADTILTLNNGKIATA